MSQSILEALENVHQTCLKNANNHFRLAWIAQNENPLPHAQTLIDSLVEWLGPVEPEKIDEHFWLNDLFYSRQICVELGDITIDYDEMLDRADSETALWLSGDGSSGTIIRAFRVETPEWLIKARVLAEVPQSDLATLERIGKIDFETETNYRAYLAC